MRTPSPSILSAASGPGVPALLFPLAVALAPAVGLAADRAGSSLAELRELEDAVTAVVARCAPAFVFIGGGSGFSISPDGYILTNEHVVAGVSEVVVHFSGGLPYRADVVGHDPQGDVALLKLRGDDVEVPWLEMGDSRSVVVGQRVVALGDPFLIGSQNLFLDRVPPDYDPTVSVGIVSALHRYSDTYNDAIQVDLAVNRGNSGGPLLTLDGKVIGINGKIETRFALGINTGVGYAIPSEQVLRFLEPLKKAAGGIVRHGTIRGVEVAARAGDRPGLPVVRVVEGSPAYRAGFREGDLLLTLDDLSVKTSTRFRGILATYPEGEQVRVQVLRGRKTVDFVAALVAPGEPFLGIRARTADGEVAGALVTRVDDGSPAGRAGVEVGDIIRKFGEKEISSPTLLAAAIRSHMAGDLVVVVVYRDGSEIEVGVRLGARPGGST